MWKNKDNYRSEQLDVIVNGIKNVQKLVVTEASFSEVYNYQDADKYFFETLVFEKKAILLIHAKIQVSYDLTQMGIQIDSIHKKIIITKIPKEEIHIFPEFKYYDLQQSMWNTFTKEELNTLQQKAIDHLMNTSKIALVKKQAKQQLVETLSNLFTLTQSFDWKIEDQTQSLFTANNKSLRFKDSAD